ncbi:MAG: hypothetical protein ACOYEG_13435 [Petrimonas sp.]|jgi:hypothetical protein
MANKTESIHSVHTFMLPLRWDYLPKGYNAKNGKAVFSFDERTKLDDFNRTLLENNLKWRRIFYKIKGNPDNYNENTYFHAFATKGIFDLQQSSECNNTKVCPKKVMLYYEYKLSDNKNIFQISSSQKDFYLKINKISLSVYNTGIAILAYQLLNEKYENSEDVLAINEFGRRIYPGFLQGTENATSKVKEKFHAKEIKLTIGSDFIVSEDFSGYDDVSKLEMHGFDDKCNFEFNNIVSFPKFISNLFSEKFVFDARSEKEGKIRFNLLADDRMFFQCWYGNNKVASSLSIKKERKFCSPSFLSKQYINNPFWYAFIFGDRSSSSLGVGNQIFMEQEIEKATYARWAEYGTLYGFSRDSFVAVSVNKDTLKKENVPDIGLHMQTMYYRMAVLSLAQRASVLRFSAEITDLADLGKHKRDNKILDRIKDLYLNYIEFINKLYFREITSHIQGIEIYNHFQKAMGIDSDVKNLENEMKDLYNYAEMIKQYEIAHKSTQLNKFAFPLIIASLIAGILGINFIGDSAVLFRGSIPKDIKYALALILAPIAIFVIHEAIRFICKRIRKNK